MAQLTLPKNSKVKPGKTHAANDARRPRTFKIYRWDPDAVSYTHLTLPTIYSV